MGRESGGDLTTSKSVGLCVPRSARASEIGAVSGGGGGKRGGGWQRERDL